MGREGRTSAMPPPPEWLGTLPIVGTQAVEAWQKIAVSPAGRPRGDGGAVRRGSRHVDGGHAGSMGWLLVQFLLTLAIAGVMYAKGESAADGLLHFGRHLAGSLATAWSGSPHKPSEASRSVWSSRRLCRRRSPASV